MACWHPVQDPANSEAADSTEAPANVLAPAEKVEAAKNIKAADSTEVACNVLVADKVEAQH